MVCCRIADYQPFQHHYKPGISYYNRLIDFKHPVEVLEVVNIAQIDYVKILVASSVVFGNELVFVLVDVNPVIQIPFGCNAGYCFLYAVFIVDYALSVNIPFYEKFFGQRDWSHIFKINLKGVALFGVYFKI